MSLWSRLFGGKESPAKNPPETHEGFTIYPEPINEGSRWRVSARIEKQIGGELKSHRLIRADTLESADVAAEASAAKARQMIDEQGERLFD
ncbi:HlyU family transcriptional regulator [Oceaniglobus trochenteri]|uniref:HlyU family transcriptional regulator n=1 Tax=Oceaniglobus trochenteri TaxID=2763260 RepID=UPI001CFF98B4|nr:HlyU family transcriptional regulator [Oceaniglobus trochenteri]